MTIFKCEACGGELKRYDGFYECEYCGSKYLLDATDNVVDKKLTEANIISMLQKSIKHHEKMEYAEELELLIEVVEADENNSSALVKLGRCYRCLNFFDKAIEFYNKAIKVNPLEGTAYTNTGTIHLLRQDYADAAECYEKGLPLIDKAEFDYWVAYANYAVVVAKLGNPKKAESMIQEAEARGYKNGPEIRKMAGIEKKSFFSRLGSAFRG